MNNPKIVDIKITPNIEHQNLIGSKDHYINVHPIWNGVDRPDTGGWCIKEKYKTRMIRAILAGVVCVNPRIVKDIYGKTYVQYDSKVGKYTNADLKKLGF